MKLTHSCIVTNDIEGLCDFYHRVLGKEPTRFGEEYAEFDASGATLALCSRTMMEQIMPGEARCRANLSLQLEFEVASADEEYRRLQKIPVDEIKEPTDYPWGNRAFYFRDPDGNVVGVYSKAG